MITPLSPAIPRVKLPLAAPQGDEMVHERFDARVHPQIASKFPPRPSGDGIFEPLPTDTLAYFNDHRRIANMNGHTAQPDDPGTGPFHVDFAAHDAALMARTWKIAFWTLAVAAVFTALVIGPYIATNWTRITNAVACSEEVV